jgi:hypothetical protein
MKIGGNIGAAMRTGYFAASLLVLAGLSACGPSEDMPAAPAASAPTAETPMAPKPPPIEILAITQQRINDLKSVREALAAYATAHSGEYPKADEWNGFKSFWGESLGAAWIPELVPDYIASLPRDPAISEVPDHAQYLYKSNGKDYKLIAMYSGDCGPGVERDGIRIDPQRNKPTENNCWAYGYWTKDGEAF